MAHRDIRSRIIPGNRSPLCFEAAHGGYIPGGDKFWNEELFGGLAIRFHLKGEESQIFARQKRAGRDFSDRKNSKTKIRTFA